jgi:hypothetical protein
MTKRLGHGLGRCGSARAIPSTALFFGELRQLEHDAEKRMPVFGKDRAQTTSQSEIPTQPKIISF